MGIFNRIKIQIIKSIICSWNWTFWSTESSNTTFILSFKMVNSTKRLKTRFDFSEPSSGTSSRTDCRAPPEVKVDFSTNSQTTSAGLDSQTRNIRYIFLLLFWPLLLLFSPMVTNSVIVWLILLQILLLFYSALLFHLLFLLLLQLLFLGCSCCYFCCWYSRR